MIDEHKATQGVSRMHMAHEFLAQWLQAVVILGERLGVARTEQHCLRGLVAAVAAVPGISAAIFVPDEQPGAEQPGAEQRGAEERTLRLVAGAGPLFPLDGQPIWGSELPPMQLSFPGWTLRTGQEVICPDVRTDPRAQFIRQYATPAASAVCLPIHRAGALWGVLWVVLRDASEHFLTGVDVLRVMLGMAERYLDHRHDRLLSEQQERYFLALHEVGRLLSSSLEASAIVGLMVDVATGLFDLDLCCALRPDDQAGGLPDQVSALQAQVGMEVRALALGVGCSSGYLVVARKQPLDAGELRRLQLWAGIAGSVLENRQVSAEQERAHEHAAAMAVALLRQSGAARGAVCDVADLAMATARRLGRSAAEVQAIELAALLQDIDHLHTLLPAASPESPTSQWGEAIAAILTHQHERMDGSGRLGVVGEAIPLGARILAACAAVCQRVTPGEAGTAKAVWLEVRALAGPVLDPAVVRALQQVIWTPGPSESQAGSARPALSLAAAQPPPARPEPTAVACDRAELRVLTDRQREILLMIAQGLSNREIAERLYLSETTVKTHVSRILQKLKLADRTKAAVFMLQRQPVI